MIVGIGTDIVEVDRIRDSLKKFGEKFIDRILLPAEREYCLSHTDPAPNIAARFAAKEAIAKAFGTGMARRSAGTTWKSRGKTPANRSPNFTAKRRRSSIKPAPAISTLP